jgi:DNA-binding transcriptional MerR regulator
MTATSESPEKSEPLRVTGKSEGAFRTIGEVAESLDLPQHVLRFWETRFPEIEPVKRGGGRRYYRPRDVELVAAIRYLLYGQGYTIKGVQRLLKEQGVRAVIEHTRGAGPGPRAFEPAGSASAVAEEHDPPPHSPVEAPRAESTQQDETLVLITEPGGELAAPERCEATAATSLVALAPRPPATLTLPAVRVYETPAEGISGQNARKLREALDELAECKRMLELTRGEPAEWWE